MRIGLGMGNETVRRRGGGGWRSRLVPRAAGPGAEQVTTLTTRATWLAAVVLCSAAFAQAPATQPDSLGLSRVQRGMVRRAVARVSPSVVTIETVGGIAPQGEGGLDRSATQPQRDRNRPRPRREPPSPPVGSGAGFQVAEGPTTGLVFSADGLLLTSSFNFVRDPAVITVRLADGTRRPAKLLARDEIRRLAMLKIDAAGLPVPNWAAEEQVHVGQSAIALGRGFGGDDVGVSVGIISGLERMGGNAIQTDAKLSPANYGGPLIDMEGRVIGLCVPMSYLPGDMAGVELYDSGIGFAVPAWQAEPAATRLAKGASIRRGVLGIRVDPESRKGVRIVTVADPSPAKAGGLMAGDVLAAIDDQPINGWSDLQRRLAFRAEGDSVALTILRSGQTIQGDATLVATDSLGPFPPSIPGEDRLPPGDGTPQGAPPKR